MAFSVCLTSVQSDSNFLKMELVSSAGHSLRAQKMVKRVKLIANAPLKRPLLTTRCAQKKKLALGGQPIKELTIRDALIASTAEANQFISVPYSSTSVQTVFTKKGK